MKLVKEHINFERGLDPKDAMSTGDILFRKKRELQKYFDTIAASNLFYMSDYNWPEFSFTSKEILGPDSKLCTNDMHYGEHAEYTVGYGPEDTEEDFSIDDGSDYIEGFFLAFDNNGYVQEINSLKDLKTFLGLNDLKEHINFERGLKPKEAMGIGMKIPSKMGGEESGYTALFNNGTWSIEKYKNMSTVGDYSLVVVNDKDFITDWTIKYDDGTVAFDNPYKLPLYIKNKVKKLYKRIKK